MDLSPAASAARFHRQRPRTRGGRPGRRRAAGFDSPVPLINATGR